MSVVYDIKTTKLFEKICKKSVHNLHKQELTVERLKELENKFKKLHEFYNESINQNKLIDLNRVISYMNWKYHNRIIDYIINNIKFDYNFCHIINHTDEISNKDYSNLVYYIEKISENLNDHDKTNYLKLNIFFILEKLIVTQDFYNCNINFQKYEFIHTFDFLSIIIKSINNSNLNYNSINHIIDFSSKYLDLNSINQILKLSLEKDDSAWSNLILSKFKNKFDVNYIEELFINYISKNYKKIKLSYSYDNYGLTLNCIYVKFITIFENAKYVLKYNEYFDLLFKLNDHVILNYFMKLFPDKYGYKEIKEYGYKKYKYYIKDDITEFIDNDEKYEELDQILPKLECEVCMDDKIYFIKYKCNHYFCRDCYKKADKCEYCLGSKLVFKLLKNKN